jgi:hypothetical protein
VKHGEFGQRRIKPHPVRGIRVKERLRQADHRLLQMVISRDRMRDSIERHARQQAFDAEFEAFLQDSFLRTVPEATPA